VSPLRSNFNGFVNFEGQSEMKPFDFAGKGMEFPTLEQLRQTIDPLNKLQSWCAVHDVEIVYLAPHYSRID